MCVPAPGGTLNSLVLAAARLAGVDEVYRVGGAQAVAALAYGTATIPSVDRIVGPGNAYVAEAKRQVFGRVGIDGVAGPSEVVILADEAQDARHVAIDLLAQAEHDEAAQSILITTSPAFADRVAAAVEAELPTLPRRAIAGESWRVARRLHHCVRLEPRRRRSRTGSRRSTCRSWSRSRRSCSSRSAMPVPRF